MVQEKYPNPFAPFYEELDSLRAQLNEIAKSRSVPQIEIIDGDNLCKKLGITRQTLFRWRKQNRIPFIQQGAVVRYDFNKVVQALEEGKS